MPDNADIAVDEFERKSLPAHVAACGRRYETLRKDIRHGNARTEAVAVAVGQLRWLVAVLVLLSAGNVAQAVVPELRGAVLSIVARSIVGGGP